jgi:hypothetical protein
MLHEKAVSNAATQSRKIETNRNEEARQPKIDETET